MRIAAAYIRVSTDMQTEYSPDSQLRLIRDYAKRNDLILSEEYIFADEGISGRKADKRPAFQKMIFEAKRRKFEAILIYNTSRFTRNHEESVVYRSMLKREGIEVISITQPNIDEKTDLLMNALYAVMDERYSLDLSENVRRGMIEKAMRGECVSSVPFGYRMSKETGKPVIEPSEAKILNLIFDRYLNTNEPTFSIARYLNSLNIPSPKGKKWDRERIDLILENPFYCGYIRWNMKDKNGIPKEKNEWIIRKGNQPVLISEETHHKVLEKMSKNRKLPNKKNVKMAHWVSGLVRCADCCSGLNVIRSATKADLPYLRCRAYGAGRCTETQRISVTKVEELLIESLDNIIKYPQNASFDTSNSLKYKDDEMEIDKLLEQAQKKLNRIKASYEKGIDTIDEYQEGKARINGEIASLKKQLDTYKSKANLLLSQNNEEFFTASISDVKNVLLSDERSIDEKYNAVRTIISKIIYSRKDSTFEVFYFMP